MKLTPEEKVIRAAMLWWRKGRPIRWTLSQHRYSPAVNRYTGSADEQLAIACGILSKHRAKRLKR